MQERCADRAAEHRAEEVVESSAHTRGPRALGAALVRQVVRLIPIGALCIVASSAVVLGFRALGRAQGVPISFLTRDPAAITDSLWSLGAQSTFGIILWAAATGILALGVALLWSREAARRWAWFLLATGALSLLLTLDDAFLLHEEVLPSLGIPEMGVYAGYAALAVVFAAVFFRELLATDYVLLAAFVLAFGASLAIDNVFQNVSIFYEDGFKLYGVVFWLAYATRTTLWRVREGLGARSRGAVG
jgi:hypothetical protein